MTSSKSSGLMADLRYRALKDFIVESTGLVYYSDKDEDFCRRLEKRLEALGLQDCGSYLDAITKAPGGKSEFDKFVAELTIGETYFFRHIEQFEALKTKIFPDIIARNQNLRRLRVWCAGCSIGAEPYSLAIQLADEFSAQLQGWDVKIIGTDINREFLARAEAGRFDEWAFRTTDAEFRNRNFTRENKSWVIKSHLRNWVDFHYHNLVETNLPPLPLGYGHVDLVICRNVMIYFNAEIVATIIPTFERILSEDGWLIIGHAEQPYGATQLRLVQIDRVTSYTKAASSTDLATFPSEFSIEFPEPVAAMEPTRTSTPAVAFSKKVSLDAIEYLKKLADAGQFELALAQCDQLLLQDPNNATVFFYRALVSEQTGRDRDVETSLQKALQLDPGFVMAHYYLGLFYERRGDDQRRARCFQSALSLLMELQNTLVLPEADGITVLELRTVISKTLKAA